MKITASKMILGILESRPNEWLACHEIVAIARDNDFYMNENAAANRVQELSKEGLTMGRTRAGKRYKEWSAVKVLAINNTSL